MVLRCPTDIFCCRSVLFTTGPLSHDNGPVVNNTDLQHMRPPDDSPVHAVNRYMEEEREAGGISPCLARKSNPCAKI